MALDVGEQAGLRRGEVSLSLGENGADIAWHVRLKTLIGASLTVYPDPSAVHIRGWLSTPLGGVEFTCSGPVVTAGVARACPDGVARVVEVSCDLAGETVDGPSLSWSLGAEPMRWERDAPAWRRGMAHLWPALFGAYRCDERTLREEVVRLAFPERMYVGRAALVELTYTRPRWPGVWLRRTLGRVDVHEGVPIPGDRVYGFSAGAASIPEIVAAFVADVCADRDRYDVDDDAEVAS